MKKFALTFFAILTTCVVFAQRGEMSVGVNLGYGTEIKNFKFGTGFNYCVTDNVEIAPSFEYFFKNDGVSAWAINGDAHYLFHIEDKLRIYPLAGLTLAQYKYDFSVGHWDLSATETRLGVNIGGGIKYEIAHDLDLGFELKYQALKDYGQAVFHMGIAYKF